ncbi:MAG: tyrosine-type recombinase/integrase [Endozoicomonas sp. (ex Botrylloides leachii)]|nr:tyrosine-type recombinase/integrase [Endozoicomonas sp. (ex Botrylloides leachii)]
MSNDISINNSGQAIAITDMRDDHTEQITPLIDAITDADAIEAFLERKNTSGKRALSQSTYTNYRRNCYLLLDYCNTVLSVKKTLSKVTLDDAQAFATYIAFPPPSKVGYAKRPFGEAGWKPFVVKKGWKAGDRALSETSVNRTIAGLKSLYSWMQKTGFVQLNPFALLDTNTQERKLQEAKSKDRIIQMPNLKAISRWLGENEQSALESKNQKIIRDAQRKRWLFFAYLTSGLRISELLTNGSQSLQQEYIQGKSYWTLNIIGKGNKPAQIPVAKKFIDEFSKYRLGLGKSEQPNPLLNEPFFYSLSGNKPIRCRQTLYNNFKEMMASVANGLHDAGLLMDALKVRSASTHWLRHSFVSIGIDQSQDIAIMSELARHSDLKTTMGYNKSNIIRMSSVLDDISDSLN